MATLSQTSDTIVVSLTSLERLGALHGQLHIPRSAIRSVATANMAFPAVKGIRAPGILWPSVTALGTWRYQGGKDFVAAYRRHPGSIVLDLTGYEFQRVIISVADPKRTLENLHQPPQASVEAQTT